MRTAVEEEQQQRTRRAQLSNRVTVAALWTLALFWGVVETWYTRHRIFSDGISYLEIAGNYAAGRWHDALNAYWSPLYCWILAVAFVLFHPTPYWQVATLHLVNLAAYVAGLFAFSRFLREVLFWREESGVDVRAIYVGGYAAYIFAGLNLVGVGYCSPDMLAMLLMIVLATLVLRVARGRGSVALYVALGVVFGLSFLARTAFGALSPLVLLCVALCLLFQGKPVLRPLLLICGCGLLTVAPFVAALSVKEQRFTLGDSGTLNYGWEISGAARSIHWQGEPGDIGRPLHPTQRVMADPGTYIINRSPVPGTYPPWYDPSYWYRGIQPKVRVREEARALFFNGAYSVRLLVQSPVFLPCLVLMLLFSRRAAWGKARSFWPVLMPAVAGIALYCLVFVDKRYVAAFLVVIWTVVLVSVVNIPARWRRASAYAIALCALLFLAEFHARDLALPERLAVSDLIHHREAEQNLNYLLAQRFRELGLKPGDAIGYIGLSINADWTRLDGVRVVGEVPVKYDRPRNFTGSRVVDNASGIGDFWHADEATRQKILDAFRAAGAKMVVTDGFYYGKEAQRWPRVLRADEQHLPVNGGDFADQENSRYYVFPR